jgi:hypothetical protein
MTVSGIQAKHFYTSRKAAKLATQTKCLFRRPQAEASRFNFWILEKSEIEISDLKLSFAP